MKSRDIKNKLKTFSRNIRIQWKKARIQKQNMVGKRVEKVSPKIGTNYNEFDKFQ